MSTATETAPAEAKELEVPECVFQRRVTHTDTALIYAPETTFEEWRASYAFYDRLHERGKWWLGDCIKFAEGKFPDRYVQAIEMTGLSYSRLTTIVSICGRIEPNRRRADLPFSFHEAVAYLPYQKADYLLDRAIKEHWSKDELSDAVAKSQGLPTKAERKAAGGGKGGRKSKAASEVLGLTAAVDATLPQTANAEPPKPIDIQATVTPVPTEPRRYVWNGYLIITSGGVLLTNNEVLPLEEANRAARLHKFTNAEQLVKELEASAPTPASPPAPVSEPSAAEQPKEPSVTPTAILEPNQHVALERAEAAINQFHEASRAVDWGKLTPLQIKKWLNVHLLDSDKLIDRLAKRKLELESGK